MRILKFPITTNGTLGMVQLIEMPHNAVITGFEAQRITSAVDRTQDCFSPPKLPAGACIWVAVDPDNLPVNRRLMVVGTGYVFDEKPRAIFIAQDPPFVWHLLYLGEEII